MNKFRLLATSALALLAVGASTAYALENNVKADAPTVATTTKDNAPVIVGDGKVNGDFVDQDKALEVPTNTEQMTKEGVVNGTNADTTKEATSGLAHSNTDYPEGVQAGTWADTSKPEDNPAQAKWKQERKSEDKKADSKADAKKKETAPTDAKKAEAKNEAKRAEAVASKAGLGNHQGNGSKVLPNTAVVR